MAQKSAWLLDGEAIDMNHPRGNPRWQGVGLVFKAVACNEAISHSYMLSHTDTEESHVLDFQFKTRALICSSALFKINNVSSAFEGAKQMSTVLLRHTRSLQ